MLSPDSTSTFQIGEDERLILSHGVTLSHHIWYIYLNSSQLSCEPIQDGNEQCVRKKQTQYQWFIGKCVKRQKYIIDKILGVNKTS